MISGTVTFKVGDDVFPVGPQTAVRMTGEQFYSLHNDADVEAELLIFSTRLVDPPFDKLGGLLGVIPTGLGLLHARSARCMKTTRAGRASNGDDDLAAARPSPR